MKYSSYFKKSSHPLCYSFTLHSFSTLLHQKTINIRLDEQLILVITLSVQTPLKYAVMRKLSRNYFILFFFACLLLRDNEDCFYASTRHPKHYRHYVSFL